MTLDPSDFPAWFKAMRYTHLNQAAAALGMKRAQIANYHRGSYPVPLVTQLAMLYILETGRDARHLRGEPLPAVIPERGALIGEAIIE